MVELNVERNYMRIDGTEAFDVVPYRKGNLDWTSQTEVFPSQKHVFPEKRQALPDKNKIPPIKITLLLTRLSDLSYRLLNRG